MNARSAHAYAYVNVEPDAKNYDTELYQALLQQYGASIPYSGLNIATPGQAAVLTGSYVQASLTAAPTYVNNVFTTLAQVLAQVFVQTPEEPRTPNNLRKPAHSQSLSEPAEPFPYAYASELEEVRNELHQRRGSDAQEQFMFDVVAPFIETFGTRALYDVNLTLETMPRTAKYFFPYLLGHLEHEETFVKRREMLEDYRESADEDIRVGALEAIGFLDAS